MQATNQRLDIYSQSLLMPKTTKNIAASKSME
jgi:hypothetical protein